MLIEEFNLCLKLIYISFCLLLFPFLKAAFKYTSIKKVHFVDNFTLKCKMWDKLQIFLSSDRNKQLPTCSEQVEFAGGKLTVSEGCTLDNRKFQKIL